MTSHRRDPYLWIHLAGLATVPIWLDLCLSGLAVGDPVAPPWLELTTLGLIGALPILWMQLRRPFYIFSVPGLAVRPDKLAGQRRRLLSIQRGWLSRLLVLLSAIALLWGLFWLYQLAPIAADMTPFAGRSRTVGWLIGAVSFLFANLFVQVPATVLPLLLASKKRVEKTVPLTAAAVLKDFTVWGVRLAQILPDWAEDEDDELPMDLPTSDAAESAIAQTPGQTKLEPIIPDSQLSESEDGVTNAVMPVTASEAILTNSEEPAEQGTVEQNGTSPLTASETVMNIEAAEDNAEEVSELVDADIAAVVEASDSDLISDAAEAVEVNAHLPRVESLDPESATDAVMETEELEQAMGADERHHAANAPQVNSSSSTTALNGVITTHPEVPEGLVADKPEEAIAISDDHHQPTEFDEATQASTSLDADESDSTTSSMTADTVDDDVEETIPSSVPREK